LHFQKQSILINSKNVNVLTIAIKNDNTEFIEIALNNWFDINYKKDGKQYIFNLIKLLIDRGIEKHTIVFMHNKIVI
jgi:hypothetical protein